MIKPGIKIQTRIIIEVAGFPKEHVEEVIKKVVEKIKSEKKVTKYKIFEAEQHEKIFSTFTEIEIEFKDQHELSAFCFDYMPSSIEILSPTELKLIAKDYENLFNDLLGKLHHYDMIIKNLQAQLRLIKKH
ncbi:MAG: hypothetical protein V1663_05445 [archaeon]